MYTCNIYQGFRMLPGTSSCTVQLKNLVKKLFNILYLNFDSAKRWWCNGQHWCLPSIRSGFDSRPSQTFYKTLEYFRCLGDKNYIMLHELICIMNHLPSFNNTKYFFRHRKYKWNTYCNLCRALVHISGFILINR